MKSSHSLLGLVVLLLVVLNHSQLAAQEKYVKKSSHLRDLGSVKTNQSENTIKYVEKQPYGGILIYENSLNETASPTAVTAYMQKVKLLEDKLKQHSVAPFYIDPKADFGQIRFSSGTMSRTTLATLNEKTDSLDIYFSKVRYRPDEIIAMEQLLERIANITRTEVKDRIGIMQFITQHFASPTLNYVNTNLQTIMGNYKSYFITAYEYRSCDLVYCSSDAGSCSTSCLTNVSSPYNSMVTVSGDDVTYYHVFVTKTIGNIEKIVGYQRVRLTTDTDILTLKVAQ
ncbi:MAG: hypothetical protein JNM36_09310 [Chitinophagales bacterium]|jgi:hypothetical protein|nr:hypothetical protein [Chitinophagales bacterium]